jgi:hypothetical protein
MIKNGKFYYSEFHSPYLRVTVNSISEKKLICTIFAVLVRNYLIFIIGRFRVE